MYRSIGDFVLDWKYESDATLKILRTLTDQSLSQRITQDGRSLGFLAWHITLTLGEMGSKMGLDVATAPEDTEQPAHAAEIASAYEVGSRSVLQAVKSSWTDASLEDEVDMYGEKWKRGSALSSLVMHQTHHRAQMTVLMRQAGLKVPGIYGPAKEEWVQLGMPPQK
jgi:uncharacterized damage-inducible protein DinB